MFEKWKVNWGLTQRGVGMKMKPVDGDEQGWLKLRLLLSFLRFVDSPPEIIHPPTTS